MRGLTCIIHIHNMKQRYFQWLIFQDQGLFHPSNAGEPRRIGKMFILCRSDRLENSMKITAMARFIYNLYSNMYPNCLRDMSKNQFFWTGPLRKKMYSLRQEQFKLKDLKIGLNFSQMHTEVRIHKKIKKFGIHEYQKIWYSKS